jgi:hypothetical protein
MAMKVKLTWDKPINLGPKADFLNNLASVVANLPTDPGIYVFARRNASKIIPIYVGKSATGLRGRLKNQFNNLNLMTAVKKEPNGDRMLLLGRLKPQKKQEPERAVKIAERAHIEHALTAGFALVNIQGTKTPKHEIGISGRRSRSHPFPGLNPSPTVSSSEALTCRKTRGASRVLTKLAGRR